MNEERFPSVIIQKGTSGYVVEIRKPQKRWGTSYTYAQPALIPGQVASISYQGEYYEVEVERYGVTDWSGVLKILVEEAGYNIIPDWFVEKYRKGEIEE